MFIDDSLAKAKLRDIYRDSQDGQLRFVEKYIERVTAAGTDGNKKRSEKMLEQMFADMKREYGAFFLGQEYIKGKQNLKGKQAVYFSSYIEPIASHYEGVGNVTCYNTYTAFNKRFLKAGEVINLVHAINLHEHFLVRTIKRVKPEDISEAFGLGIELLKAISKHKVTYDEFPDDSYIVVDDYAVPLEKRSEKPFGVILKTVLIKSKMIPSQLSFFDRGFKAVESGDSKMVVISKKGDVLYSLTEGEYGSGTLYQENCNDIDPTFINIEWSNASDFFSRFVTYRTLTDEQRKTATEEAMNRSSGVVFLTKTKEFSERVEESKRNSGFGSKIRNR